jgi:hypothetical protein
MQQCDDHGVHQLVVMGSNAAITLPSWSTLHDAIIYHSSSPVAAAASSTPSTSPSSDTNTNTDTVTDTGGGHSCDKAPSSTQPTTTIPYNISDVQYYNHQISRLRVSFHNVLNTSLMVSSPFLPSSLTQIITDYYISLPHIRHRSVAVTFQMNVMVCYCMFH